MPTTECATEVAPPELPSDASPMDAAELPSNKTSKLLKGLLFGFAATVTIGLALASWYVGVRIVAADETSPSRATTGGHEAPATDSMAEAYWYAVPAPVNLYLQVAGLGPKRDADFASSLQAKGFHAQVQSGEAGRTRILIGPFATRAELEETQRNLQSAGVLAVEASN
jgi:hypothetical protein